MGDKYLPCNSVWTQSVPWRINFAPAFSSFFLFATLTLLGTMMLPFKPYLLDSLLFCSALDEVSRNYYLFMASLQASPWFPELDVTKKSSWTAFLSSLFSYLYFYTRESTRANSGAWLRKEVLSEQQRPEVKVPQIMAEKIKVSHLSLLHFWQFAVSPSQLEAASSLLLKRWNVEFYSGDFNLRILLWAFYSNVFLSHKCKANSFTSKDVHLFHFEVETAWNNCWQSRGSNHPSLYKEKHNI